MDASTLRICESHPDIDRAACALVALLVSCKGEQMHGQAGVLADLTAGRITLLHQPKAPTIKIKS